MATEDFEFEDADEDDWGELEEFDEGEEIMNDLDDIICENLLNLHYNSIIK